MSNLRELKKKIATTNKIKKIFLVMKTIASSKMKKAQNDVFLSNQTIDMIKKMFFSAIKNSSDPLKILSSMNFVGSSLSAESKKAPELFLLISSDKGLCGNYNNLVLRKINSILREKNDYKIFFVGRKLKNILSQKIDQSKILKTLPDFKFNEFINDYEKISQLLNGIFDLLESGEISNCKILYVFSENVMSREIKVTDLFDLDELLVSLGEVIISGKNTLCDAFVGENEKNSHFDGEENKSNMIFEPNDLEVINILKKFYFRARFFNFFRNAYFSELASRMVAMDNASRNSSELVKKMTLKYNKKRQENITKELIDIVNGAENV